MISSEAIYQPGVCGICHKRRKRSTIPGSVWTAATDGPFHSSCGYSSSRFNRVSNARAHTQQTDQKCQVFNLPLTSRGVWQAIDAWVIRRFRGWALVWFVVFFFHSNHWKVGNDCRWNWFSVTQGFQDSKIWLLTRTPSLENMWSAML